MSVGMPMTAVLPMASVAMAAIMAVTMVPAAPGIPMTSVAMTVAMAVITQDPGSITRPPVLALHLCLEGGLGDTSAFGCGHCTPQHFGYVLGAFDHQVRCANDVFGPQAPDMKIVDRLHVGALLELLLQGRGVDPLRRPGHEIAQGCHGSAPSGHHHKDGKQDGAARICVVPVADRFNFTRDPLVSDIKGLPPHQAGGQNHTDGLDNITHYVYDCSVQREVLACPAVAMAVAVLFTTVGMSVPATLVVGMAVAQDFHQDEIEE